MENKKKVVDDIETALAMRGYRIQGHDSEGNPIFRDPDDRETKYLISVIDFCD